MSDIKNEHKIPQPIDMIQKQRYEHAFDLKNAGKIVEAIQEFKRIIMDYGETGVAIGMIAGLYYSELDDPKNALPYAKKAVILSPTSEMASMCLVHCLFHEQKQDEIAIEIQRYLRAGGKLDLYITLFKENGLTPEMFLKNYDV